MRPHEIQQLYNVGDRLNGRTASSRLRNAPHHRAVLAISSLSERNGKKLIQEGAAGYFEKGSMTPEKLENAISEILKKRLLVPDESDA